MQDVLLEFGPDGPAGFSGARITAETPEDLPALFAAVEEARAQGKWVAGLLSYELGYCFEDRLLPLLPEVRDLPLADLVISYGPEPPTRAAPGAVPSLEPEWSGEEYAARFATLHDYIGAGDIYQANLTFPLTGGSGEAAALYETLRQHQPVPYAALMGEVACLSPELFFEIDGGVIRTRPMKGTAPRGETPEADRAAKAWLAEDPKNRAENLMIVDLLRNDLSRIAKNVLVPKLFHVESYTTVHQMVSEVTGEIVDWQFEPVLRALFPCGSITGAPKIRAMEIIRDLESRPRGAYCGAMGWIAPDGRARFNVAIRTLHAGAQTRLDVGGGVVWDSTAQEEYAEALLKARFARA
ncbi:aminodeoxychorismate synthase component I [Paracoccaceae bacterium GXU_MW_L88]